MEKFRASIAHDEKTVKKMNQTVHDLIHGRQKVFYAIAGVVLVLTGASGGLDQRIAVVLVAIGCWCFLAVNYYARTRTAEMKKTLNGYYPSIEYIFLDDMVDMYIKKDNDHVKYSDIVRLAYDKNYAYFFPTDTSVFMIARSTIEPNEFSDLMTFLSDKTGCEWIKTDSSNVEKLYTGIKKLFGKKQS